MKKWGRPPKGFYYYFEGTEVSDYFEFDELEEENEKNEKNIERQEYVMQKAIAELIDSNKMTNFIPLSVENKLLMANIVLIIDKTNGYYLT